MEAGEGLGEVEGVGAEEDGVEVAGEITDEVDGAGETTVEVEVIAGDVAGAGESWARSRTSRATPTAVRRGRGGFSPLVPGK
jgi:hypothetical protein